MVVGKQLIICHIEESEVKVSILYREACSRLELREIKLYPFEKQD